MARPVRRSVGSYLSPSTTSNEDHILKRLNTNFQHSQATENLAIPIPQSLIPTTTLPQFRTTVRSTTVRPKSINSIQFDNVKPGIRSEPTFNEINQSAIAAERERVRMEFYATYDVMTGVRIAATLAGFFGLMVFLVVYKSRSHSSHPLKAMKKNPNLAAQAAIVMQAEEQRELEEAWQATSRFFLPEEGSLPSLGYKRERISSLGNISAPPALHRGFRFSSFAGYSSLMEPPRRFSYSGCRRKSTSESSRIFSAYHMGESFGTDEYLEESEDEEADDEFDQGTTTADIGYHHYLNVPGMCHDSRRSSDITCCSTESSFMERRCSTITLGLTPLPSISSRNPSRRPSHQDSIYIENFPNIHVTQPTPKTSPHPSERNLLDQTKIGLNQIKAVSYEQSDSFDFVTDFSDTEYQTHHHNQNSKTIQHTANSKYTTSSRLEDLSSITIDSNISTIQKRRAPLASLSSFKISSADYQDSDLRSLGSDSVFAESYADTDEDMEQFSTDSGEISDSQSPNKKNKTISSVKSQTSNLLVNNSITLSHELQNIKNIRDDKINLNNNSINNINNNVCVVSSDCVINNTSCSDIVKTKHSTINYSNEKLKLNSGNLIETKAIIEQHIGNVLQETIPPSNSGCAVSSTVINDSNLIIDNDDNDDEDGYDDDDNTKSSECIDIEIKINDNNPNSVILELPVLSTNQNNDETKIQLDPCIPGPSRKFSKETLF